MPNLFDRIAVRHASSYAKPGSAAHPIVGKKIDPILSCNFLVLITGLGEDYGLPKEPDPDQIGFSKISGIGVDINTEEVIQGSSPVVSEIPISMKYTDVTLEHGMALTPSAVALMRWYQDVRAVMFSNFSDEVRSRALVSSQGENQPAKLKKRDICIEIPVNPQAYSHQSRINAPRRLLVGPTTRPMMSPRNYVKWGMTKSLIINLLQAWPVSASFSDLNSNENAVLVHSMKFKYGGIEISSSDGAMW